MTPSENYSKIKQYYRKVDLTNIFLSQNNEGNFVFAQSKFETIEKGFYEALNRGYFTGKRRFCDAGCGIGTVVALANVLYQFETYGVEIQEDLYAIARQCIQGLKENFENPTAIMRGDFGLSSTYTEVEFNQIDVWFNYYNNFDPLVKKIRRESPSGTLFLLLKSGDQSTGDMHGMKAMDPIGIDDLQILPYQNP